MGEESRLNSWLQGEWAEGRSVGKKKLFGDKPSLVGWGDRKWW